MSIRVAKPVKPTAATCYGRTATTCDSPTSDRKSLTSYHAIVNHNKRNYIHLSQEEFSFYAAFDNYDEMLRCVAYATNSNGKRHGHQRRLKKAALDQAYHRLKLYDFESCQTFEQLLDLVEEAIGHITGIGELMAYDTANRLGSYLGLQPTRIHLHAGTRMGAGYLGLGQGVNYIEVTDLPSAFHALSAVQAEDCLCIYKDSLKLIRDLS